MQRAQPVTVEIATEPDVPPAAVAFEAAVEGGWRPVPTSPPTPRVADRIRDALLRWLEEDM